MTYCIEWFTNTNDCNGLEQPLMKRIMYACRNWLYSWFWTVTVITAWFVVTCNLFFSWFLIISKKFFFTALAMLSPFKHATFKVTLEVLSEFNALSNMRAIRETVNGTLRLFILRNLQSCQLIWWLLLVYLIILKIKQLMACI